MLQLYAQVLSLLESDCLDLEAIHRELYPDREWDNRWARYLHLRLAQLLEKLMSFIVFLDQLAPSRYYLQQFAKRGWERYFDSSFQQGLGQLPEAQGGTELIARYQSLVIFNDHRSDHSPDGSDLELDTIHRTLDEFYLLEKLKYGAAALNGEIKWGTKLELPHFEVIIQDVTTNWDSLSRVIQAYYLAYVCLDSTLLSQPDDQSFLQLKGTLARHPQLPAEEALDLFSYALNYCMLRSYANAEGFSQHLTELYTSLLESGLLLENGLLSPHYYKSIILLMCRLKEYGWAGEFLEEWKDRITGDEGRLAYRYNQAVLAFQQGRHREVIRLLYNEINEFEDLLYGIAARVYLCRALWEMEEFDTLEPTLRAFSMYLRRKKELVERERRMYQDFVKLLTKVLRLVTSNPDRLQKGLPKVGKELAALPEGAAFQWLCRIISVLELKGRQ